LGARRDGGRLAAGGSLQLTEEAGGVWSQAGQSARALGAGRVVALAGAPEKRALALDLGADAAVDYRAEDWEDQVRAATGGGERPGPVPGGNPMQAAPGVADLALDGVAGSVTAGLLRLAVPRTGRIVTVGGASGAPPELDVFELNRRNLTVTGFSLPTWARVPGWRAQAAGLLLGWLRDGRVRVVRGPSFPLDRAADAHRALEGRTATGKVVLRVS